VKNTTVEDKYNSQIASTLRKLLEDSPITHKRTTNKALAGYLCVKQQSVSSWANGTTIPDTKHIAPIAEYFGVSCDYLLGVHEAPTHQIQSISDATGLSTDAIDMLQHLANPIIGEDEESIWKDFFVDIQRLHKSHASVLKLISQVLSSFPGIEAIVRIAEYANENVEPDSKVRLTGTNVDVNILGAHAQSIIESTQRYRSELRGEENNGNTKKSSKGKRSNQGAQR
jgi:transcriptional regulator with XRE-family HTH domain